MSARPCGRVRAPRGRPLPPDAALIGIGANLRLPGRGPLTARPSLVIHHLVRVGLQPRRMSRLYTSRPWPRGFGPGFVNAVVQVRCRLAPPVILGRLLAIEQVFGRCRRRGRNAPRSLDLDLLAVGAVVTEPHCEPILPHPRMEVRAFVLRPLLDVAPGWRHPVHGAPVRTLLARATRPEDTRMWKGPAVRIRR